MQNGAGIMFVSPTGNGLFLRRTKGDHAGTWAFPGGKVEQGESTRMAARREAVEEIGSLPTRDLEHFNHNAGFHTYKANVGQEFEPRLNDEHDAHQWAPLHHPPSPLHPGVDQVLRAGFMTGARAAMDQAGGIDATHDVRWMSVMSEDGDTVYIDRTLPEAIENNGKRLIVAKPLAQHERAEWAGMRRQMKAFANANGREPNDAERKKIYLDCHNHEGTPAERSWIEANGYSWKDWEAWTRGELSRLENRHVTYPPPDADVKPFRHERGVLESTLAADAALAFDRETQRHIDGDGHLHVGRSHISKATVNEYWGHEIPEWKPLELDPDRKYKLLRHPEELEKAANTFNGKPLLNQHQPVSSADCRPELVIGSTGTDAEYNHPYLDNSLVVWKDAAIKDIQSEARKDLSCGYRYDADMTPGEYEGEAYDGVMRNIRGNHVALVTEGRAGSDVVVGDAALQTDITEELLIMPTKKPAPKKPALSRQALLTHGALTAYLGPKLAQDTKIDMLPGLRGITHKNFAAKKPVLVAYVNELVKGKLAQDARIEDLAELLDVLEAHPDAIDADPAPQSMVENAPLPDTEDADPSANLRGFLKDHGMDDETTEGACQAAFPKKAGDEGKPPPFGGEPETGAEDEPAEREEMAERNKEKEKAKDQAMDAKIKAAVKLAHDSATETQRKIRDAERKVRPYVGDLNMAFDSAQQVYSTALTNLGMDKKKIEGLPSAALEVILEQMPVPGSRPRGEPRIAQDAASAKSFDEFYPDAKRIRVM
jgi:hypothetical protein